MNRWSYLIKYTLKNNYRLTNFLVARFFRNLIEARNTEEGRKAIEEYAKSDAENPPDLANGSGEKLLEYITYFNLRYLDSLVRTPVENGRNLPETG